MMDSVRALPNAEIVAQEGDFRSLTGDFYRSKDFRKVSMDFWTLSLKDVTHLFYVCGKVELSPI
jgi:hypothetical protein